jgi:hypothetical protein
MPMLPLVAVAVLIMIGPPAAPRPPPTGGWAEVFGLHPASAKTSSTASQPQGWHPRAAGTAPASRWAGEETDCIIGSDMFISII